MNTYRLAVISGDGIGPEVTACAVASMEAAARRFGFNLDFTHYDLGSRRYLSTGEVLPDSILVELAAHDAILLGAVGTPEVPPGVLERGLLLRLRFEFDLYVNFRPVKLYPGVTHRDCRSHARTVRSGSDQREHRRLVCGCRADSSAKEPRTRLPTRIPSTPGWEPSG